MAAQRSSRLRQSLAWCAVIIAVTGTAACSAADSASRAAGNLGTRICVINNWTQPIGMTWERKDTSTFEGAVPPGGQSCAEGTKFNGTDLAGAFVLPEPAPRMRIEGSNPWLGTPSAWLAQEAAADSINPTPGCTSRSGMEINELRVWDNGVTRMTITRLPDDQWKEFTLMIQSSDGNRVGSDPCDQQNLG